MHRSLDAAQIYTKENPVTDNGDKLSIRQKAIQVLQNTGGSKKMLRFLQRREIESATAAKKEPKREDSSGPQLTN